MHAPLPGSSGEKRTGILFLLGRVVLLLLPLTLLLICSIRGTSASPRLLWLGTLFQLLACGLSLFGRQGWREPTAAAIIMLYVIALSWMLLGSIGTEDWFLHLAQSILLVVPLVYFAVQCLMESGAPAMRRARHLAYRLGHRLDWPKDLHDCRLLPEVKALREAVHLDASPALSLLSNPRPEVRVAALSALEFRQNWRPGQPQIVLQLAQHAVEPEVRAAAINALANVNERNLIEGLAEFLHDSSPLVRQTAADALLWNTEQNWPWIRLAVRRALADPVCQDDGPIRHEGELLTAEAVGDLTAWTAEKGVQALRAALTLGCHYHRVLSLALDSALVEQLRGQLADGHTSPLLRLELARVLHTHRELDGELLRRLIDSANPAPLRLIAVEVLLEHGSSVEATAALHELARLPNREIALGIAQVVQRRLGVDLGLPRDRPLPPLHSREAVEVARRVLVWAAHQDEAPEPAFHAEDSGWHALDELQESS
ncbi:MAG TPA: HEAT repeat domain-containing protein [Gemmataceae bacterium]|nr:HEAT repeat domain-containing protein [Gemmataceae bacterium]